MGSWRAEAQRRGRRHGLARPILDHITVDIAIPQDDSPLWDVRVGSLIRLPTSPQRSPVADLAGWALTIGLPRLAAFCARHRDVIMHLPIDHSRMRHATPRQERFEADLRRTG